MIFCKQTLFSENQAVTATAGSTNQIDLTDTGTPFGGNKLVRDVGQGPSRVPLQVGITQTFNNLTSLTVEVQVDADSAFGSPKTVASSAAIPAADLVAGYQFQFPCDLPEGSDERYLRLNYVVAGTAPTTGQITAGIVAARQSNFVGGAS